MLAERARRVACARATQLRVAVLAFQNRNRPSLLGMPRRRRRVQSTMSGKGDAALVVAFVVVVVIANGPLPLAYAWRSYRRQEPRLLFLGFEGPILCDMAALVVTWVPPFPRIVLVVPWLVHAGTWIAVARLVSWIFGRRTRP
jgi:hypothetical protein